MRAAIIVVAFLAGCMPADPTAEQFARAKAYCEKHGLSVFVAERPLWADELRCDTPGIFGSVRIPREALTAAAPPEGK